MRDARTHARTRSLLDFPHTGSKCDPSVQLCSYFLGELEKCLEDPDRLGPLFLKQVGSAVAPHRSLHFIHVDIYKTYMFS